MSDEYRCPYADCQKNFASNKNLRDHIRTHTGEKPYKCKECGQGFAQYSTLHKHYRVHDKKRPYECRFEGCDKSFTQISNRIRHERIHSGEKPFQCNICPKSFCSSSNLNQHLKVHRKQEAKRQHLNVGMYQFNRNQPEIIDLEDESFPKNYSAPGSYPYDIYSQTNQLLSLLQDPYSSLLSILSSYCMCENNNHDSTPLTSLEFVQPQNSSAPKLDLSPKGRSSAFTGCVKN